MQAVYNNLIETIGNTPLVDISSLIGGKATVLAKLESRNPLASVKDRLGAALIEAGIRDGKITENTTIVEPTSGNTGIALAFIAAAKKLKITLTMPESMSIERRKVLKALGANLVLTEAAGGMKGAIDKAAELAANDPNIFVPQQFENPANPEIHRRTTAEEIWSATGGKADILVSGVGTGGTITGVSEAIKAKKPEFKSVAVEPSQSPVISQVLAGEDPKPGPHKIQGIGAGFIPKVLNLDIIDEVIQVDQDDAIENARRAARDIGLFVGISSGAAIKAAGELAHREENASKVIVAIIPSFGERYLSSPLFADIEG